LDSCTKEVIIRCYLGIFSFNSFVWRCQSVS